MRPQILMVPGFNGSGRWHWQSFWEKEDPSIIRIEQDNWNAPVCGEWVKRINEYVNRYDGNVIIVAHSLACIALAHWVAQYSIPIAGALLVAPPDVEKISFHQEAQGFAPIPLNTLPFESIVIASKNDYYTSFERASFFAEQWGSEFINAGHIGHINAQSNIGNWVEGKFYLEKLKHLAVSIKNT